MKRLTLIAHKRDEDEILTKLQDLEAIQVITVGEDAAAPTERMEKVDADINLFSTSLSAVAAYGPKSGMLTPKRRVKIDNIREKEQSARAAAVKITELLHKKAGLLSEKEKNAALIAQLSPWTSFPSPMKKVVSTKAVHYFPGLVAERDLDKLAEQEFLSVESFGSGSQVAVLAACHEDDVRAANAFLKSIEWTDVAFPTMEGTPSEAMKSLHERTQGIDTELADLGHELESYGKLVPELENAADAAVIDKDRLTAMSELSSTASTFILEGWVREDKTEEVEKAVAQVSDSYFIDYRDPAEDEVPPTVLKNSKFNTPFEAVNNLYSLPDARGIDAVPYMTPFYIFFFGMMLSDVGYGLLLAIGTYLYKKYKKPTGMTGGICTVLCWGGLSTIVWGFLIGTFFGVDFDVIFGTTAANYFPLLMDPLGTPLPMLGICFGFGIIHMMVGVAIKMKMAFDAGDWQTAIFDNLAWMLIIFGLLVFAAPMLLTTLPAVVKTIGIVMALVGALMVLVFKGRAKRNVVSRTVSGLAGLYDITSWLSDILSYARLFALGIATGIIAQVFNQICTMLMGGTGIMKILGIIIGCALLCGLHVFNLAINTLGTFVHCARLQYVEYYGKFYEAGGKAFEPLRYRTKHTIISKTTEQ